LVAPGTRFMRTLYNFILTLGMILAAPFYLLGLWRRGNWKQGFRQRFGRYSSKVKQAITNRHVLWLHAASVGEVNLVIRLIEELEQRLPNLKIVVSTNTTTGMGELRRRVPAHVEKIYFPLDRRKWVQRALGTIHPEAIILVEAEIWPNFLWRAREMGVPTFLVNARISDKSFPRYRRWGAVFRGLFGSLSRVCCPTEIDAERLRKLGCRPDAVHVVGNLKFDTATGGGPQLDARALLDQFGVPADAPVLLGGSTHDGEEAVLAEIWSRLRPKFPNLFLIVVPRHHERAREAGRAVRAQGLNIAYRSELDTGRRSDGPIDCLVVNTTGELKAFYAVATVVFVGRTLTARGGQNPIEPATLGKAVVFGPNMQNFRGIVPEFLAANAARQVKSARELGHVIEELLADPVRRAELGANARRVVERNAGAIARTVEIIAERLKDEEIYVAEAQ
jgi:3-deoxy-D-manno-octulosonic-acid transferase